MKVRLFIGDILFEDLTKEQQEEAKQKYTDAYANIVLDRVIEMMNQGKSKKEIMDYLGLK